MSQSYWITPEGKLIHAPQGHQAYIKKHWQELDLPEDMSLTDLVVNGWIRVSGDNVMLRQVENPEVLEVLQALLTTLGHPYYTLWINSKPHVISLETLESDSITDIYKGILAGKFEEPSLFPKADADDQGMFEYQPSWGESESAGSTGMKDRGVEFMPQDYQKEVWWNRELLDYLRKNFPGKKDVIPPEPDIGYPSQASDVVQRMTKKALTDQEIIQKHNRGFNKIDEGKINPISVLLAERMNIGMGFAIQLIRSYNYHSAANAESVKALNDILHIGDGESEQEKGIREWQERWHKRGSLLVIAETPDDKIRKLQAIADVGGQVPKGYRGHHAYYELDANYILHVQYYSTEIVTADMRAKKILKVTTGGYDTISTKRRIRDIIDSLGYGYPDYVGYEYDATETDEDREKQRQQIKEDEKRRRHEHYLMKKRQIPLRKSQNPSTPPEELADLSRVLDERIRSAVAENPNTLIEILSRLSKDENVDVRRHVADNPHTPIETLTELAQDRSLSVRQYVAVNPSTTLEVLQMLAKDEAPEVRVDVAGNPNISIQMLGEFSKDSNEDVQEAVKRNPKYESEKQRKTREWQERWTRRSELRDKDKMRMALI